MNAKKLIGIIILGVMLLIQTGCGGDKAQRLQQLEHLEQQNRNGEPMLNDSLAEDLVSYFDRHGDANERMRSRYILGRTYYCLDELPRALEMYNEAADCADTTSSDCDFAKLSRVYAQSAALYYDQIQPRTQLENLCKAQWYANKGKDTLMAIECFARQADAYYLLNEWDSVVYVTDMASEMFERINRKDRSVQVLYNELLPLIKLNNYAKAGRIIHLYEKSSGFFDETHDIDDKFGIYYYVKGLYYVGTNKVDSAESLFRKELSQAADLNNRIAGCKGLQEVYSRKGMVDSIAKYANLGYVLNDSAFSLSEMQNIQKFQASYNYNHHRLLAEQSEKKAQQSLNILTATIAFVIILSLLAFFWFRSYRANRKAEILQYQKDLERLEKLQTELQDICSEDKLSPWEIFEKKHEEIVAILNRVSAYKRKTRPSLATLEDRLVNASVVKRLKDYANANPYQKASQADFAELRNLINEEIPHFYTILNTPHYTLSEIEYDVSMLLRVRFSPMDIHKLTGLSPSYVSNMRSRLLLRVYGVDGSPADYDTRVLAIS